VSFGVAWATHTLNAKRDLLLKEVKRPERKAIKQAYRRRTKALLVAGILVVLGMLVALNYLPFFCGIVNAALVAAGSTLQLAAPDWRAPIGISFYTLMALSYQIDVFREQIPGTPHLGRIALYLAFFPHIMEGPFARYAQTADAAWAGEPIKLANVYPALLRIALTIQCSYYYAIIDTCKKAELPPP
jgi:D-alanyl-lipoteichoic acid acyltransferase DltB (MBOAT superfamily)